MTIHEIGKMANRAARNPSSAIKLVPAESATFIVEIEGHAVGRIAPRRDGSRTIGYAMTFGLAGAWARLEFPTIVAAHDWALAHPRAFVFGVAA